ncbi:MAG: AgmX/PglI C-terminal domain-containing protein [Deltaproteobacteria bacterium]|nr:AgmX/PglI C-terminal domain-containing protein [Deltaproteobacteria bacterium]
MVMFVAAGGGMAGAWRTFREGGWPMYLILLAGLVAPPLVGVFGLLLVRGKRVPVGALFLLAAIPFALALLGAWMGQSLVVGAISGESVDPEQRARILAEGFAEAMSNDIFGGLVVCGVAIAASVAAAAAAASIDVRLALRGEKLPSSARATATGVVGALWIVATLVVGVIRIKGAGALVLVPVLPLLFVVPLAVLGARGAAVIPSWHDRVEGSRIASALVVAGASALLALLALQRGIEATFTSKALSAIAGESVDPSQRLRILRYAVDAGRLAPAAYAVHAILGTATFAAAASGAIGGGKHPARPSTLVAAVLGLGLLGGALAIGRARVTVPRGFAESARHVAPGGVELPMLVEALSERGYGGMAGERVVIRKDGTAFEPPPLAPSERYTLFADKGAPIGSVQRLLGTPSSARVTFVVRREHPPELDASLGDLASYLGQTAFLAATLVDEAPETTRTQTQTMRIVTVADDAIEIDGTRVAYPPPQALDARRDFAQRKTGAQYVFRPTDTVERVVRTIVEVERLRASELASWTFERTIVVDDPSRPKKAKPDFGADADAFGLPLGPSSTGRRPPSVRMAPVTVNGRLPPEVIQRILRASFGRFRLCYENGLRSNPDLAGRVTVKFVIDRKGDVASAADGGSTLPDQAVVGCIVRAIGGVSFPAPEGGVVTVVYPLDLAPAK